MKIKKDEVTRIAHLARLEFTEAEAEKFTFQINNILMYMDTLNRVDTTGIAPMTHAIAQKNAFREDNLTPSLDRSLALANAPDVRGEFFRVPKVIE
ncbi:MAG: Asp-tRNA(Asn)/Glu-tRNA(Gln) amidotransferase subunit GatC [Pseudomonadota bacterium]